MAVTQSNIVWLKATGVFDSVANPTATGGTRRFTTSQGNVVFDQPYRLLEIYSSQYILGDGTSNRFLPQMWRNSFQLQYNGQDQTRFDKSWEVGTAQNGRVFDITNSYPMIDLNGRSVIADTVEFANNICHGYYPEISTTIGLDKGYVELLIKATSQFM